MLLTTDEGYVVQPVPPLLTDLDRLLVLCLCLARHAQVVGVLDDLLHVLWLERVHDVEEVRAIGKSLIGGGVRQIPHDLFIAFEHGEELSDRELVVEGHVHRPHPGHGQQVLRLCHDLLEEVLVDVLLGRDVELATLLEELDEISLGTELSNELRGHHPSLLRASKSWL